MRIRAARFGLQQRALFPGTRIASPKVQNDVRLAGDLDTAVDAPHGQHANQAAGPWINSILSGSS